MNEFFTYASPLTLASLICDIDQSDMLDPPLDLRQQAIEHLVAIVGEAEAIEMIDDCLKAK